MKSLQQAKCTPLALVIWKICLTVSLTVFNYTVGIQQWF